jgi:uncharacterized DUF497 family protein
MIKFDWDPEKNLLLQSERKVSFEDVVTAIASGHLLDVELGRAGYSHQQVYIVALDGYAYMIPYVVEEETCFLKTIVPSRMHTKHFFRK